MAHDVAATPAGPTPWDTIGQRKHLYTMGLATPICGDDIAKDPDFETEFPTLESYLEPPC